MPIAPYALLRASINGGSVTTGAITVAPSATVQLSADPGASVGAQTYKYEIYGYPIGFTVPGGWSTDSSGVYFYSGATPPLVTLPTIANWGKFMLRLTLNGAISTNTKVIPPSQLVDEKTALSMLSPNGLADIGNLESNQFGNNWTPSLQASLRSIDTAVTAVAGANQKPPAKLLGASNLTLSGEQTIDGVLTSASRVLLIAQTSTGQNGPWVTAAGAWARPTDFNSDAQVVVGQTVFVTSGSLYAGTNWQLTSGSSIAGAKTYAQLVNGSVATSVLSSDAVATSNNALTGTTAVDGVTLTANVSRVLAVSQTTTSQNGPWLVQSGAWTRPLDFAVDAQVIAGTNFYVKPGGSTGGDTNWQMTLGSTIAGAKTFKKSQPVKHDPVRMVQTTKLTTHTYSAGVITASANGAIGATIFDGIGPATSPVMLVGDRIALVLHGTQNGIYTVTALGDGSNPYVLTRAADLNTSALFVGGVSFEVQDGITTGTNYKGTRWALTTIGTVILDTTSTAWAQVKPSSTVEYDLSLPPYNIRDYPSFAAWSAAGAVDYGRALDQFCWDFQSSPAPVRGRLPSTNGGVVVVSEPFDTYGNVTIAGGGPRVSQLVDGLSGGHACVAQVLAANMTYSGYPQVSGTAVDTAANSTALSFYRDSSGNVARHFFYNLSHQGLLFDDWSSYECRMIIRFEDVTTDTPNAHIVSCRGRRTVTDIADVNSPCMRILLGTTTQKITAVLRLTDNAAGVYGAIVHTGTGTSVVTGNATVKPTEDAPSFVVRVTTGGTVGTNGCFVQYAVDGLRYCAPLAMGTASSLAIVTHSQRMTAASVVSTTNLTLSGEQTIDGVLTSASYVLLVGQTNPAENGPYLSGAGAWTRRTDMDVDADVVIGNTVLINFGSVHAGQNWQLTTGNSIAGGNTWTQVALAQNEVNESAQPFTARLDFGAGTLVAKDTYAVPTSGVNQNISLTSDTICAINKNYVITHQYRGGKVYLYVTEAGQTQETGASTVGATATGVVRQRFWEFSVLGNPQNSSTGESGSDFNPVRAWIGSIKFLNASVSAPPLSPSVAETTLASGLTGQKFFWRPNSVDVRNNVPGTFPRRWKALTEIGRGFAWMVPRSPITGMQLTLGGFEDLTFACGTDPSQREAGLLTVAWHDRKFKNVEFTGGLHGWNAVGPDFASRDESLIFGVGSQNAGAGIAFTYFQGQLNAPGTWRFADSKSACYAIISDATVTAGNTWFQNTEQLTTKCCMLLSKMQTSVWMNWSCDAENQINLQCGRELIRICVVTNSSVEIAGTVFGAESYSCVSQTGDPAQGQGGSVVFRNFSAQQPLTKYPPLSTPNANAPPFVRGAGCVFATNVLGSPLVVPICDRPNKFVNVGGTVGPTLLADAGPFPAWSTGQTVKLAATTTTVNRSYTVPTTGMQLGDVQRLVIEPQGNTVTLVNGGPSGGNITPAFAAGYDGVINMRLNESFDLERV